MTTEYATIKAGESISSVIDLGESFHRISLWNSPPHKDIFTFSTALDGNDFYDLYKCFGDEVTIRNWSVEDFASIRYLKIRLGTSKEPVIAEQDISFDIFKLGDKIEISPIIYGRHP